MTTSVRVEPLAPASLIDPTALLLIVGNGTGNVSGGVVTATFSLPRDFVYRASWVSYWTDGATAANAGLRLDIGTVGGVTFSARAAHALAPDGAAQARLITDYHQLIRPDDAFTLTASFDTNDNGANYRVWGELMMWSKSVFNRIPISQFFSLYG